MLKGTRIKNFLDEDVVELCDDLLDVINKDANYRYLRLFKLHELENQIVAFKEICWGNEPSKKMATMD